MKLLESTKSKITKDKDGVDVPHLEIIEVVLIHSNSASNDLQHDSRVMCIFISNKSFCQLFDISCKKFIVLKIFDSGFSYIEVWFTGQNSELLERENITLVIN